MMEIGENDVVMQTRCPYCLREQWAMAVHPFSMGEGECTWCGTMGKKMTYTEWQEALATRRKEIADDPKSRSSKESQA